MYVQLSHEKIYLKLQFTYPQPVFIKSFKVDALCVPLARHPNATHNAVSIALFPPIYIKNQIAR